MKSCTEVPLPDAVDGDTCEERIVRSGEPVDESLPAAIAERYAFRSERETRGHRRAEIRHDTLHFPNSNIRLQLRPKRMGAL